MILTLAINKNDSRLHSLSWPVQPSMLVFPSSVFVLVMTNDGATLAVQYLDTQELMDRVHNRSIDTDMLQLRGLSQWAYLVNSSLTTKRMRDGMAHQHGRNRRICFASWH